MIDAAQNKASVPTSAKIHVFHSDEIVAIWRADSTRDWEGVYDRESKFRENWEGI